MIMRANTFLQSSSGNARSRSFQALAAVAVFLGAGGCSVAPASVAFAEPPKVVASADWAARSCPTDQPPVSAETFALSAETVPLNPANPKQTQLGALTYAGGLWLKSGDPRFGGLSGLAVTETGDLVAVSDDGHLFRFAVGLDPDTGHLAAVSPQAFMQPLLDAQGNPLEGKKSADAEAIYWAQGRAFISFERRHRIEGFDIGRCGGAARGVPLVDLTPAALRGVGVEVAGNSGPEALTLAPDGSFIIGIEMLTWTGAALSLARPGKPIDFAAARLPMWDGLMLTDLAAYEREGQDALLFSLHRGFDPLRGARIAIAVTPLLAGQEGFSLGQTTLLARLAKPLTVDNFEGLAVLPSKNGAVRLLLLADNNFSERQRSLLLAFDYPPQP